MNSAGDLPDGLRESHHAWVSAVNRTDLAGYAETVCEDVVWLPPGQEALRGRAAFRDWLAPFFEAYAYEFTLDDISFRIAGDWALEKGGFRTVMTSRSTGEAMEHSGRFIALWRLDEGESWRIERYVDDTSTPPPPSKDGSMEVERPGVTGIGGIFFRSEEPEALAAWYRERLGLPVEEEGYFDFRWRHQDDPDRIGRTAWSLFPADTDYFGEDGAAFMINYRVDDLDGLLSDLREAGVAVDDRVEDYPYGRFAWITDPEGYRIELWEPTEAREG